MGQHKRAFVAFDSAKAKHAVAVAEDGRDGEVRYVGEIDNSPDAVRKLVTKLSRQYVGNCIFATGLDRRDMGCTDN
jgi:hypothetical protein